MSAATFTPSTPADLASLTWERLSVHPVTTPEGWVQSVCASDAFIFTIENASNTSPDADRITAYDKSGVMADTFTEAFTRMERDWEHGNGMTWNPDTGLIYVAPYSYLDPASRGKLFIMNPADGSFAGDVQLLGDGNVLGIEYIEETRQYAVLTDAEAGFSLRLYGENFQLNTDFGPKDPYPGVNFQDLYVTGDYILTFPLTAQGDGPYLFVYSRADGAQLASIPLNLDLSGLTYAEPESLCETAPGVFLLSLAATQSDGSRVTIFYRAALPGAAEALAAQTAAAEVPVITPVAEAGGVVQNADSTVQEAVLPESGGTVQGTGNTVQETGNTVQENVGIVQGDTLPETAAPEQDTELSTPAGTDQEATLTESANQHSSGEKTEDTADGESELSADGSQVTTSTSLSQHPLTVVSNLLPATGTLISILTVLAVLLVIVWLGILLHVRAERARRAARRRRRREREKRALEEALTSIEP